MTALTDAILGAVAIGMTILLWIVFDGEPL